MNKLYLTVALLLTVATSQPAHAEQAVGQMIDDSGLVISSYEDGSVREFQISELDLGSLRLFQKDNAGANALNVLDNTESVVVANN
ncbi:MAG: hypothetical protein JST01_25265 [Cyanobacteria bacterium SZAS TMP-1]|nr:hypothetical protein [Cyanobacteria bacterium SZAS TMP-1]